MNFKIFFFLFLLSLSTLSCQNIQKKEIKNNANEIVSIASKPNPEYQYNSKTFNLYGKVESIKCIYYEQFVPSSEIDNYVTKIDLMLDQKGNITAETMYLQDNEINYMDQYFYDKMGNRCKTVSYKKDDDLSFTKEVSLNKESLIELEKFTEPNDSRMNYQKNYQYETISDSLVTYYCNSIPEDSFNGMKTVQVYNNHNLSSKTVYLGDEILRLTLYEYDNKNNLLVENEKIGHAYYEYKYNEKNKVIYELYKDDISNRTFEKKITYDKIGNIIKEEDYEDGELDEKKSFRDEFEYDNQNNWSKRIRYKLNGTKVSVLKREIKYYPK